MSLARCYHTESLASYEREQDRLDALEEHVEREAPELAKACLESAAWCDDAMTEDALIAATNEVSLLLSDPCAYGQKVKKTLEHHALMRARQFLFDNPREYDTDVVRQHSYRSNGQTITYWQRIV